MAEVRTVSDAEIAEFGFPEFGKTKVDTVWNEGMDVAYARYTSDHVKVTNVLDFRSTPDQFLRDCALDSVKIMGTRVSKDLLAAGNTQLYIPVDEVVLRPERVGGKRALSIDRVMVLLAKERDNTLSEEERLLLDENADKIAEFKAQFS